MYNWSPLWEKKEKRKKDSENNWATKCCKLGQYIWEIILSSWSYSPDYRCILLRLVQPGSPHRGCQGSGNPQREGVLKHLSISTRVWLSQCIFCSKHCLNCSLQVSTSQIGQYTHPCTAFFFLIAVSPSTAIAVTKTSRNPFPVILQLFRN